MKTTWIGTQQWDHPLFLHWPVPHDLLRPLVPEPFVLDTYNGQAWISVVPFKASHTSPRWGSGLFTLGPHWQLNIRTYIRFYEEPAVYFLTVYTGSRLAAFSAKGLSLPYQHAHFDAERHGGSMSFQMQQSEHVNSARFSATIRPASASFKPSTNSLAYWLTERYHFYSIKGKRIIKASIAHPPWDLRDAHVDALNTNLLDVDMNGGAPPLAHVGDALTTYLYPFQVKGYYYEK